MAAELQVVQVYVAAYTDPDAAQDDWDLIKRAVHEKVIRLEELLLVSRGDDGKVHVKDNAHEAARGTALGAIGGAVFGLIFPPAFLASAAVGAGLGAGAGGVLEAKHHHDIKAEVEQILPPGSSGIVAVFEPRWVEEVQKALAKADKKSHHDVEVPVEGG